MKIFPDTKILLPVHRLGFFAAIAIFFVSLCMGPSSAYSEDRLVVKNALGASTFRVDENGLVYSSDLYFMQGLNPGFWLDETGSGNKGAFFVLDQKWLQIQRRGQNFGTYEVSPFYLNIDAPNTAFSIGAGGVVGFGVFANYPLEMASGAHVTSGGVWTNASSRAYKQDIKALTKDEAHNTLKNLEPVRFSYKTNPAEKHVGFIAEDVPDLVATEDRKGMSAMDVVAVLTKVVQDQQKTIEELSRKVAALEKK